MANKILQDRYEILEKVGEGGMAVVYKAKDILLGREVAIKILRPEFIDDESFIKSFKRESMATATLSHQNIVNVYDVGEDGNIYFIVMEFINGKTLSEIIKNEAPFSPKTIISIGKQIANALNVAHKNGIIHRDVKPHNIMISDEGVVKIMDFGIAKAVNNATIVTTPGMIVGSVHYFSPEQARGSVVDAKSDIYSLGVVLYEMLTGEVPFTADNPVTIAVKHMNDKVTPPSKIISGVPAQLEEVILRCLEKYPINRYPNAKVLADALANINLKEVKTSKKMPKTTKVYSPIDEEKNEKKLDDNTVMFDSIKKEAFDDTDNDLDELAFSAGLNKKSNKLKQRNKRIILIASIVAGFILLVILGIVFFNMFMYVKTTEVPKVTGLTYTEAKKILKDAGFKIKIGERIDDSEEEVGTVLRQSPSANENAKVGTYVILDVVVEKGKTIPDVTGLTQSEAREVLDRLGIEIGTVSRENSDSVKEGEIISQYPEAGSSAKNVKQIDIIISDGAESVKVPNLYGLTRAQAQSSLEDAGLTLGKVLNGTGGTLNTVVAQSKAQGTSVKKGTAIDITISKGPAVTKTYDYAVDISGGPAATFKLTVVLGSTIIYDDTVTKANGTQLVTVKGSGVMKMFIYFNGVKKAEKTVDFTAGTIS